MSEELELISLFHDNLNDFLTNLKSASPKYKKRIEEFEEEIKDGMIMDIITNYNISVKKYEKRFVKGDYMIISKISNKLFASLRMNKLMSDTSVPQTVKDTIWDYLKTLYMYSEMVIDPDRKDLTDIVKICSPVNSEDAESGEEINSENIDQKIKEAVSVISGLFGETDSPEMKFFKELIEEIGNGVSEEIKANSGKINSAEVMQTFQKLLSGGDLDPSMKIGGLDMNKIIEKSSKKVEESMKREGLNMNKFKAETKKKMQKLLKTFGGKK